MKYPTAGVYGIPEEKVIVNVNLKLGPEYRDIETLPTFKFNLRVQDSRGSTILESEKCLDEASLLEYPWSIVPGAASPSISLRERTENFPEIDSQLRPRIIFEDEFDLERIDIREDARPEGCGQDGQ